MARWRERFQNPFHSFTARTHAMQQDRHFTNAALLARRHAAVARGVGQAHEIFVQRALNAELWDVEGRRYIDFAGGIAVLNTGHLHPQVIAAVQQQLERYTHTCFQVVAYEPYVEVCERLNTLAPGDFAKKSLLLTTGAEAVENAVKIARTATGRDAVVAFDNAYHGRTLLTMALTAKTMPYKAGFGPFAPEVYRMPMSYPYRDPLGDDGVAAARRAITQIENQIGAKSLAAIIIEPIQGEGGFIVPAPGFLSTLVDWARENGVVFIADEVQTGFARTGSWFACDHEGIVPDLITMAKGIAGGMPLAAVTGRAELLDSVHTGGLGGTYGGNPVACAAALAALGVMERDDLAGRARAINERVTSRLSALADEVGVIGEIRGRGAMIAVELVKPGTTDPDPVITKAIAAAALAQGVVILTCGTHGNVIRLLPPLVIGDELLDEGLTILEDAIRAAAA
jgi:4-aminobutyrate aminotransferase/(S)-3-amino-2-methylpropionate transaminase